MRLPVLPPVEPMLAKAVSVIRPGWLYEPKWDGFRAIVFRDGDEVEIISRNARPLARYFPELVTAVKERLPPRCVVDGEIIIAHPETGSLDFWSLQQRLHPARSRVDLLSEQTPARMVLFDLLALGDEDLMPSAFMKRRARLEAIAPEPPVHLTPITSSEAVAHHWFAALEGAGLDGIVAKGPDHRYEPGRRVMEKVKHDRTADCVVIGYRIHKNDPQSVGSLLLALHADEDQPGDEWSEMFGGLVPIGVAASFPAPRRRELMADLEGLVVDLDDHPWGEAIRRISATPGATPGSRWNPDKDLSFIPVRPERVAEVRYNHMDRGRLRHPAQFLRWRPDRDPASCGFAQLERASPLAVTDILFGDVAVN